jgi:hypothetical protein
MPSRNLIGGIFGKLTVTDRAEGRITRWCCSCACGNSTTLSTTALVSGNTRSCGCLHGEVLRAKRVDLTGQVFARWTVLRYSRTSGNYQAYWVCRCECGSEKIVAGSTLRFGNSKSCGCLQREIIGRIRRTHGQYQTREHQCWRSMKGRCQNPNDHAFPVYGGKGITVSPKFQTFEGFREVLGPCPPGYTLDRWPDNSGNYEPGNVRWASRKEQSQNRPITKVVECFGERLSLSAWSERSGLRPSCIYGRLQAGWPAELAVTLPVGSRRPH